MFEEEDFGAVPDDKGEEHAGEALEGEAEHAGGEVGGRVWGRARGGGGGLGPEAAKGGDDANGEIDEAHAEHRRGDADDAPVEHDGEAGHDEEGDGGGGGGGEIGVEAFGCDVGLGGDEVDHRGPDAEDEQEGGDAVVGGGFMQDPEDGGEGGEGRDGGLDDECTEIDVACGRVVAGTEELGHVLAGGGGEADAAEAAGHGDDPADVDDVAHAGGPERTCDGDGGDERRDDADGVFESVPDCVAGDGFTVHAVFEVRMGIRSGVFDWCEGLGEKYLLLWSRSVCCSAVFWGENGVRSVAPRPHSRQFVLTEALEGFLCVLAAGRLGCERGGFFEMDDGVGVVGEFAVGHAEVVLDGGIFGSGFDGVFEEIASGAVDALGVVGPGERIGGAGIVGHAAVGGLGERQSDVEIAVAADHEVREIVGGDGLIGLDFECGLVVVLGGVLVAARLLEGAEDGVCLGVARVRLEPILPGVDGFAGVAVRDLGAGVGHDGAAVGWIDLHGFCGGGDGGVGVASLHLEDGELGLEVRVVGDFGDLRFDAGEGFLWLLVGQIHRDEDGDGAGGGWINGEGLFEQGAGFGGLLLGEFELTELHVGLPVPGIDFEGLFEVGVGAVELLLRAFGHATPEIAVRIFGMVGDGEFGGVGEEIDVAAGEGYLGESFVGFHAGGIQFGGVGEALLGGVEIAFGEGGAAEQKFDLEIFRVVLFCLLEGIESFVGLAVVHLDEALENGYIGIGAVGFFEVGGDGLCLGEVLVGEEQTGVGDLEGNVFRVFGDQVGVDRDAAVELTGVEVVVFEQLGALDVVCEIFAGLAERVFGFRFIALPEVELGQAGAGHEVFGVGGDGGFLLFEGGGEVSLALEHGREHEMGGEVFGVE